MVSLNPMHQIFQLAHKKDFKNSSNKKELKKEFPACMAHTICLGRERLPLQERIGLDKNLLLKLES